ncbi:MAG TPA: TcpE family conjugal transfer membrane protein [Solirubrobacterales bacterium]|nr:TcpE family conjugal transfer membrane protein [Solirubrobacterales bacterium]
MSQGGEPIRSYQRIFRPERRIYQLEGRSLPVPGGVPLRWLAYACAALVTVLVIGSGSPTLATLLTGAAALAGLLIGDRTAAALAGAGAFSAFWVLGFLLGLLDWPLRLIVVPVAIATLATQATPDGRRADRFAASWLALRLAPRRRSLGRALPPAGVPRIDGGVVWIAPDEHSPRLRRARIRGTGTLAFASEVALRRGALRPQRLIAGPIRARARSSELRARNVALGTGEDLEIRP